jgi:hypothetical protein
VSFSILALPSCLSIEAVSSAEEMLRAFEPAFVSPTPCSVADWMLRRRSNFTLSRLVNVPSLLCHPACRSRRRYQLKRSCEPMSLPSPLSNSVLSCGLVVMVQGSRCLGTERVSCDRWVYNAAKPLLAISVIVGCVALPSRSSLLHHDKMQHLQIHRSYSS